MEKRYSKWWVVIGLDGLAPMFAAKLSTGLSEGEIGTILQRLASAHLTPAEILSASLRKRQKGYRPLLEVRRESRQRTILSVGENPHYIASIHSDAEIADMDLEFVTL